MIRPLLPLRLTAHATPWTDRPGAVDDAADFRRARASVLERDGHACRFCGFRGRTPYMQVHHLDHDHANHDPGNLVTACAHCHAPNHLGLWADGVDLAWLPELTQPEVSALCRALILARNRAARAAEGPGPVGEAAALLGLGTAAWRIEEALAGRVEAARAMIGTSDPRRLASAMLATAQAGGVVEAPEGIRLVVRPEKDLIASGAMNAVVEGWIEEEDRSADA